MKQTLIDQLDATGYADGQQMETPSEIRDYFDRTNMIEMFGECDLSAVDLSDMADYVIETHEGETRI